MPGPYGLTAAGFVIKPADQILSEMQDAELSLISPALNLQPTGLLGVLNGIMMQAFFELWQLAGVLYGGMDPDLASGDQLTGLSLITGTQRTGPIATLVPSCVLVFTSAQPVAAGTLFANITGQPNTLFTNKSAFTVTGAGSYTQDFVCTVTGPIVCNPGTLNQINSPLNGWASIANPRGAIVGQNEENDPHLRARRVQELEEGGSSTADAIRSDILNKVQPPGFLLNGIFFPVDSIVAGCRVLFNDLAVIDANGLPPNSIEAIVFVDGTPTANDDAATAAMILDSKAAGIGTNGTSSAVATNSQGQATTIFFTRPTELKIWVDGDLLVDNTLFPPGPAGLANISEWLVQYAAITYLPGSPVYYIHLEAQCFTDNENVDISLQTQGVLDVTRFQIGLLPKPGTVPAPPAFTATIPIGVRQIATLALTDVTLVKHP